MTEATEPDEQRLASELVEAGGDIAGASVGGALGLLGGPVGVAAGAAGGVVATRTFRAVGAAIRRRWLEPRQEARAGGAYAIAADEVRARLERGDQLRDDGFFEKAGSATPPAEELLEGTLKAATEAYEQRKVPFLGRLFAGVAFREDITPAHAHFLLRLADGLTWRQLACLAERGDGGIGNISGSLPDVQGERPTVIWAEIEDLAAKGLVGMAEAGGELQRAVGFWEGGPQGRVDVGSLVLTDLGRDLYELMHLHEVAAEDKEAVSRALQHRG